MDLVPTYKVKTSCALKNDGLGWSHGFVVEYEGVTFGFRANQCEVLAEVKEWLPPECAQSNAREVDVLLSVMVGGIGGRRGVKTFHLVYDGWTRIVRTLDRDLAMKLLQYAVRLKLSSQCRTETQIRGTYLEWKGKGVLLSSNNLEDIDPIADAVTKGGGRILSEGFTAFRDSRLIVPGNAELGEYAEPSLILFPFFRADGRWRPKKFETWHTILELIGRTSNFDTQPESALANLAAISTRASCYSGAFRNAERLLPFISRCIGEPLV